MFFTIGLIRMQSHSSHHQGIGVTEFFICVAHGVARSNSQMTKIVYWRDNDCIGFTTFSVGDVLS